MEQKLVMGILCGMTTETTIDYLCTIHQETHRLLGGLNSLELAACEVNMDKVSRLQHEGKWHELEVYLAASINKYLGAADFIVIATNTMHKLAEAISRRTGKEILHIGEVTTQAILEQKVQKVALLGTKFTMEEDFYRSKLEEKGIEVVIPNAEERELIHHIIYEELGQGERKLSSRAEMDAIIRRLESVEGIQGVILGCTELPLLYRSPFLEYEGELKIFDTSRLHAKAAALKSLGL